MQTKHLCVLIHIWTKGEVGAPLNWFKPSSKIFLLTVPRRCFFCGSLMLFLSCIVKAFMHVCLLMPCGHLLVKDWPLDSRLWCLIVTLSHFHWYPGSSVMLDVPITDLCPLSFFHNTERYVTKHESLLYSSGWNVCFWNIRYSRQYNNPSLLENWRKLCYKKVKRRRIFWNLSWYVEKIMICTEESKSPQKARTFHLLSQSYRKHTLHILH